MPDPIKKTPDTLLIEALEKRMLDRVRCLEREVRQVEKNSKGRRAEVETKLTTIAEKMETARVRLEGLDKTSSEGIGAAASGIVSRQTMLGILGILAVVGAAVVAYLTRAHP